MKYTSEIQAFGILEKFSKKSGCSDLVKDIYLYAKSNHKENAFDIICASQFPKGVVDCQLYAWLVDEYGRILKYLGKKN